MLRKFNVILTIIISIIIIGGNIVYGFVWKASTDNEISAIKKRVETLEQNSFESHEKLNEIGFNLKSYIQACGGKYTEFKTNK